MNILLIYPTKLNSKGKPIKFKKAFLPPLALAILDSLIPEKHNVKIINDLVENIDFSDCYDLVAITSMTTQITRTYEIADKFRQLGVKVVIGGSHVKFLPDEAIKHADSIVIGEAENIWPQLLIDAEKKKLKEIYEDKSPISLHKLIIPKWNNASLKIYPKPIGYKFPLMPIYSTRGCPYGCTFCSVTKFFGKSYRIKPIENILAEIDAIGAESYFFVDDNIAHDVDYSKELFKALAKKNIRWFSQASIKISNHPDLIDLAAKSGCFGLLLGIETINKLNLVTVKKQFNKIEMYEELFLRLRTAGIYPFPSIMFGFDYDTLDSFQNTIDFLMRNKIGNATFSLLTPLPGTDLFDDMDRAGRILHKDWSKYDLNNIVFRPKNFTIDELYDNFWKSFRELYSIKNILKRMYFNLSVPTKTPVKQFLEDIFYQFFFRQTIYSNEHPFSGGMKKID